MKTRHTTGPADLIPTSSMADIAFLLIIFFMVTATFSASQGLDLGIPPEDTEVFEPVASVHVRILPDASLLVNGNPLEVDQLLGYLAPKLEQNPKKPVIIQPDPQARYGAMMSVYDELRQGKEKLGLSEDIRIALPTRREVERFWSF